MLGPLRGRQLTDVRRPFPLPTFKALFLPPSAALSASSPPGPKDLDRVLRAVLVSDVDSDASLDFVVVLGWIAMDFRERRGRAGSPDMLSDEWQADPGVVRMNWCGC